VVGGGSEEKDERDRRGQERGVVDGALDRAQVGERAGKADGEQEAEQDLGAGDEGAQLLEQLAVFAFEPFLDRFIFGASPSRCSITSSVATIVPPPSQFRPAISRSLDLPCSPGMGRRWLGWTEALGRRRCGTHPVRVGIDVGLAARELGGASLDDHHR
jgi:hypothetical protein